MPETRVSLTHKFDIAGHEGYLTVGLYERWQPGEIFIQMSKEGSTIGGLMDSGGDDHLHGAAIRGAAGEPGEEIRLPAVRAERVYEEPGYPERDHSITDYVFRWLGCQFIKGYKEAIAPRHHAAGPSDEGRSARWKSGR